jgi:hypothetical protein
MPPKKKPDDDEETETQFSITDEVRAELGNMINGVVKDHVKRMLGPAIKSAMDPAMTEIKTLLAQRNAPAGNEEEENEEEEIEEPIKPKGAKGKQKVAPPKEDPRIAVMQRKMEAMEQATKLEREQAQAQGRDNVLKEHLIKGGVKPELVRPALLALRETTRRDEKTGEWTYVAKRDGGQGAGGYDEELDLAAGAKDWLGTEEGKAMLAPPTTPPRVGSGLPRINGATQPLTLGRTQPSADPKAQRAQAIQQAESSLTAGISELLGGAVTLT